MSSITVRFLYHVGFRSSDLSNARLVGSWNASGRYDDEWSTLPMEAVRAEDGGRAFRANVELNSDEVGTRFYWGVVLDNQIIQNQWGIPTEVGGRNSTDQRCTFVLSAPQAPNHVQEERYFLTHCRRFGYHKHYRSGEVQPGVRFSVWAPNARKCEVVLGMIWQQDDPNRGYPARSLPVAEIAGGYIADDGTGCVNTLGPFQMERTDNGVWTTAPDDPALRSFERLDHRPYMYRITRDDGSVVYRTDLFSRCQVGSGHKDPKGSPYDGNVRELDGTVGCSVVLDVDLVTHAFEEAQWPEERWDDLETFWASEFTPTRPVPSKVQDLVIYELHLGALGFGNQGPGTLREAIDLLDYLGDLGINAIELLPMHEFGGNRNWGYATSHFLAIEYSGGGRDKFKHFVRECHRRGIAVIMDVVYNHYVHNAERAQWLYDSTAHERNIYYWYEGRPADYTAYEEAALDLTNPNRPSPGHGGYVDNMSTGYAPRYSEEMVRKLFISSAAALVCEFHVDGLRVDQTTSIHQYNVRHADGAPVANANIFGAKLLRELTRTLRLLRPDVMLIAEDHSDWDAITRSASSGGIGFDARWYADFYHHLVGDTDKGSDFAKLLKTAGLGDDRSLAMDYFAAALASSGDSRITYNESHDEAGNGRFTKRSMVVAVNGAPLVGDTRRYAESRCRFTLGMTILSAGTPMFLFGEEVGADNPFLYDRVLENKIDLERMRREEGSNLFAFYKDMISFRLTRPALQSRSIEILHVHNENRVVSFRRFENRDEFLIVGSLSNRPYERGYEIRDARIPAGLWLEVFNSDSSHYGGNNVGNAGALLPVDHDGRLRAVLPSNGFIVLHRET